jgi:hypothetical protein
LLAAALFLAALFSLSALAPLAWPGSAITTEVHPVPLETEESRLFTTQSDVIAPQALTRSPVRLLD